MSKLRKLALASAIAAAFSVAAASAPASAEVFDGSYNVTAQSSDPGLVLHWSPIAAGLNFNLPTAGSSTDFDLFSLWTDEGSVEIVDDIFPKPISAIFSFTLPTVFGGSVDGQSVGETFFGIFQRGKVTWDNGGDKLLNFGNGGQLLAHLDDATFNGGFFGLNEGQSNGANVHATFTLVSSAVPETATWAMMIMGMAMVGAGLRMRRRQTASAAA